MSAETIAHRFTERFVAQDVPGLVALFTEDASYQDLIYGRFEGREALQRMFETFFREANEYTWDLKTVIADATTVAAEGRFQCRTKASGRWIDIEIMSVFELAGNQIQAYREYWDLARGLLQIGVDPAAIGKIVQRRMAREAEA
jgi:steroid delta-isomerase-like uncharacterized protein